MGGGLQVMLEKVAGLALVNKLRAILLMEVDCNFHNNQESMINCIQEETKRCFRLAHSGSIQKIV